MTDLQKFCATESDPRPSLRKPMRWTDGIVATNGHILICVPDDGRECEPTHDKLAEHFARYKTGPDEDSRQWIEAASIELPPANTCGHCHGAGFTHRVDCVECSGDGYFEHGSHEYTCKACDGEGSIRAQPGVDGAKREECVYCTGTGQAFQSVAVAGTHFQRRYLALLADLPGCQIGLADDPLGLAVLRFKGGWGALMPCRD